MFSSLRLEGLSGSVNIFKGRRHQETGPGGLRLWTNGELGLNQSRVWCSQHRHVTLVCAHVAILAGPVLGMESVREITAVLREGLGATVV